MAILTLCKDCKWAERKYSYEISLDQEVILEPLTGKCLNQKAPVTDFVNGTRRCDSINSKGCCPYFERREIT